MDFFNKAKESFTAAGKGFTQKASDVSGLAKMTLKIKEEEKQLENAIQELGNQLYNTRNTEAKEMFPELTESIRTLYSALEKDRVELAFLKGKKVCPNCGAELEAEVQCCTFCGINVENVVRPSEIQRCCVSCGSPLVEGAKFCNNCGAKIEQ